MGTLDQRPSSLAGASARTVALDLMHRALEAVDPAARLREQVRRAGNVLLVGDRAYDLDEFGSVYVLGAGKATYAMAVALEGVLGDRLTDGFIVVKHGQVTSLRDRFGPIRRCRFAERPATLFQTSTVSTRAGKCCGWLSWSPGGTWLSA